jgi:hypothetical protein
MKNVLLASLMVSSLNAMATDIVFLELGKNLGRKVLSRAQLRSVNVTKNKGMVVVRLLDVEDRLCDILPESMAEANSIIAAMAVESRVDRITCIFNEKFDEFNPETKSYHLGLKFNVL